MVNEIEEQGSSYESSYLRSVGVGGWTRAAEGVYKAIQITKEGKVTYPCTHALTVLCSVEDRRVCAIDSMNDLCSWDSFTLCVKYHPGYGMSSMS